jgi:hypothetical protein
MRSPPIGVPTLFTTYVVALPIPVKIAGDALHAAAVGGLADDVVDPIADPLERRAAARAAPKASVGQGANRSDPFGPGSIASTRLRFSLLSSSALIFFRREDSGKDGGR